MNVVRGLSAVMALVCCVVSHEVLRCSVFRETELAIMHRLRQGT